MLQALCVSLLLASLVSAIPILPPQEPSGKYVNPCDALVPEYCLLPFPNNYWTVADSRSETGIRIALTPDSLPKDNRDRRIDPKDWNIMDGFSAFSPITTFFPNVDISNLPKHWDAAASMDPSCPTVLLDSVTGEKLPHFAEIDEYSNNAGPRKMLMIWPLSQLRHNRRYIVGIRYLKNTSGRVIPPSDGFLALRDRLPTNDPDIEARRQLFEDIFSRLNQVGVQRNELQIAWDFTTMSETEATKRMLFMRDDSTKRVNRGGPRYQINQVTDNYSTETFRHIVGDFYVPHYMTNNSAPGSRLVIDPTTQLPLYQGEVAVRFTLMIPRSLAEGQQSGRVVQFGHGLFGSQSQLQNGFFQEMMNRYKWVGVAVDWWGMCEDDVPAVVEMLSTDISNAGIIPERSQQGMINALMSMKMVLGNLASDPLLTFGGVSVVDKALTGYYGNSQGGIFGSVYMSLSQDVSYGALGVPGGPYSQMLPRSVDFTPFGLIINGRYPDPLDRMTILSLMQIPWDRAEPAGYLQAVTEKPFPETQPHRVLLQYALGDAQVHYLSTYGMARSLDADMFTDYVTHGNETLYGIAFVEGIASKNMAVGYIYDGVPLSPLTNTPPSSDYDTHGLVRRDIRAQDQINEFFNTGMIRHNCDGPCRDDFPVAHLTKE